MTLTPEQITASRERLISEGFTPASKAIRVHDQLLALMAAHEVNTKGAVQSIEDLQTRCESMRDAVERSGGQIDIIGNQIVVTFRAAAESEAK